MKSMQLYIYNLEVSCSSGYFLHVAVAVVKVAKIFLNHNGVHCYFTVTDEK